jgi:hypothetical protein
MIQPNELRIGNYIEGPTGWKERIRAILPWKKESGAVMVVSNDIELDFINYIVIGDVYNYPIKSGEIHGIDITEDWVMKLGFKESEKGSKIYCIDLLRIGGNLMKALAVYTNPKSMNDICVSFVDYYGTHPKIEQFPFGVKYVHQLQNLYFVLTGQELQYKKD